MATPKSGRTAPKPLDLAEVRRLAAEGLTNGQIANIMGCGEATVARRGQLALRAGRFDLGSTLRGTALRIASDDKHRQQPSMVQFLLERMDGLVKPIELRGAGGGPVEVEIAGGRPGWAPVRKCDRAARK